MVGGGLSQLFSVIKWEGSDDRDMLLSHLVGLAPTLGATDSVDSIAAQLKNSEGVSISLQNNRKLIIRYFESYDYVTACAVVDTSCHVFGNDFTPFSSYVSNATVLPAGKRRMGDTWDLIKLKAPSSADDLAKEYFMTTALFLEMNPTTHTVEGIIPQGASVKVLHVWQFGRDLSNKLTHVSLNRFYYCARHGSVRVTGILVQKLFLLCTTLDKAGGGKVRQHRLLGNHYYHRCFVTYSSPFQTWSIYFQCTVFTNKHNPQPVN